jgi:uncharacterized membrane protein
MKATASEPEKWDFVFYLYLFFIAALFGWLWEGCIYIFQDDAYVNRGFLTGPWLPIYGIGAVMLEILFHKWRDRTFLTFLSSMCLCTVLEYLTGWYLELTWGVKWWDYSQMNWNLHGRICFASSILFGLGGAVLVCVVAPLLHSLYRRIPGKARTWITLTILVIFITDAAYSALAPHMGRGITYR